jgi:hypothetical protein
MEKRSCGALPGCGLRGKFGSLTPTGGPALRTVHDVQTGRRFPSDRSSIGQLRREPSRPSPMESSLFDANFENSEVPPEPLSFVLGRDHGGHWIVQEANGLCGGLFASEDAAISYAKSESAGRGTVIRFIPDPIELHCSS